MTDGVHLSKSAERGDNGPKDINAPTFTQVQEFHQNADTDTSWLGLHHTLGPYAAQSAGGDHNHNGGTSHPLFYGKSITGTRGTVAYQQSIEALLVQLGAVNQAV